MNNRTPLDWIRIGNLDQIIGKDVFFFLLHSDTVKIH